ncbi:MAG: peptidylprolyl isomerase [Cyclobacteriaceae bacterium]
MKSYLFLLAGLLTISCSQKVFKEKWLEVQAPESFEARFETTQGYFDIRAERKWSPAAVDRLYQLIKHDFYTDIAIFRVVPDFVVQFGISGDSTKNAAWMSHKVPDEPVIKSNILGTVSFARGGPETRNIQIFINIKDNSSNLDVSNYAGVKGFPVVAEVTSGMDVVTKFYDGYGNAPATKQGQIFEQGNEYLKENFPKLDYINSAYLLKKKKK